MNLQYLKIGIPLALIGGILGIIAFILMLVIPPSNPFASLMPNTTLILLGYVSLIASIIIVVLILALMAKKLLTKLQTILILVVILGIVELLNLNFPYPGILAIIGGALAIIGGLLAWIGLRPEPTAKPAAKPEKVAAKPAAKPAKAKEIAMKTVPILKVEGIGPKYREKLTSLGIKSTKDLLEMGRTPSGRDDLAKKTGISAKLILEWVVDADLMRLKGVSEEYADLLDEAEVKDVADLAKREPESLHAKLAEINEKKKLVRRLPYVKDIKSWIEQAKKLPKIIQY